MSKYGNNCKFPLCPRGIEMGRFWLAIFWSWWLCYNWFASHLCLFGWCYTNLYNFFGSICKALSSLLLIPCHRSWQLTMPGNMARVLHAVLKQTYSKGNGEASGDGSRMIRRSEGCRGTISSWSWRIRWMDLTWRIYPISNKHVMTEFFQTSPWGTEKCWDRFSIPRWWKPTIFDAKKFMARFANNDCCWHILLTTTNPQEVSCWNQLRGPVSHRFSSWIAVNFATAATNSLAAEADITSYRVHERPRWVWNKRIHRMQKKRDLRKAMKSPLEQCHDECPL